MPLHRAYSAAALAAGLLAAGSLLAGCSGSSGSSAHKDDQARPTGQSAPHATTVAGRTSATYTATQAGSSPPSADAMRHTADLLGDRAKSLGLGGATFEVHGSTISARVPGHAADELRQIAATADLSFRPVVATAVSGAKGTDPVAGASVPADIRNAYTALTCAASSASPSATAQPAKPVSVPGQATIACDDKLGAKYLLAPAALTGTDIASATSALDKSAGNWTVNLAFTSAGGHKFGTVTGTLSQQQPPANQFAILLDGDVLSAPAVASPILGGQAQISGDFTQASAKNLAALIDSGALPVALTVGEVSQE